MTASEQAATAASRTHARSSPDACSVLAEEAQASAFGTAARAIFWVALEQPGPWGRQATTESHLPAAFGAALDRACAGRGGRFVLVRRPAAHPDTRSGIRRCYVAWSGPGAFLLATTLVDTEPGAGHDGVAGPGGPESPGGLAALEGLDLAALAAGDARGVTASLPGLAAADPVLLVCTNGSRDVCCAVRGRPVAAAGHAAYPGRVWECSHTGGHRYAPTGVLLPWGRTLARLDDPAVPGLLEAATGGHLPAALLGPSHDRGWSALAPHAQAAESTVRELTGETDLVSLTARAEAEGAVRVEHRDGRAWRVDVERVEGSPRAESCGKAAVATWTWTTRVTDPASA